MEVFVGGLDDMWGYCWEVVGGYLEVFFKGV